MEQYKKGVMQKLFSREIRFRPALSEVEGDETGEEFPEWEEKTFQELYSFKSTNSLSREKLNYLSGSIYNVHYGDIHTKFNSLFDISKETVPFINEEIDLSKINKDSLLQEGDLVIADA
ncbi:MAG: hypothetical protein KAR21_02775, partial [Spirochaetales bacterium]|nr:hypothetical protein [Spirochaetales bacterium]